MNCPVCLRRRHGAFWLHFSLADARVERWLRQSGLPPEAARGAGRGGPARTEVFGGALVLVLCDLRQTSVTRIAWQPVGGGGAGPVQVVSGPAQATT